MGRGPTLYTVDEIKKYLKGIKRSLLQQLC